MESAASTYHLKFYDQNVYGVPLAPDMKERTEKIRRLAGLDENRDGFADIEIAAFQELFTLGQRCRVRKDFDTHPYKYVPSDIDWKFTTSGLGQISRYPFVAQHFERYPRWVGADSDKLANKGIAHVRIMHPTLGLIDVFNTHTQAAYKNAEQYAEVRAAQLVVLSKFVKKHSSPQRMAIITGDLNMVRGSVEDGIFHYFFSNFHDVLEEKFPEGVPATRRRDNPYVCKTDDECSEEDQALDYVFVRPPEGMEFDSANTRVDYISSYEDQIVSDHDGLLMDLVFTGSPPETPTLKKRAKPK